MAQGINLPPLAMASHPPVRVLAAALLPIQLLTNMPEKAANDGMAAQAIKKTVTVMLDILKHFQDVSITSGS